VAAAHCVTPIPQACRQFGFDLLRRGTVRKGIVSGIESRPEANAMAVDHVCGVNTVAVLLEANFGWVD
jgi:hypothetical protein